jgi:ornithine cyclodeaminase/alanine dehydrogenase-like protein (mu-crystallin family)
MGAKQHVTLIGAFEKNASEKVRVAFKEFSGELYLDIRIYAKCSSQQQYVPTTKGVCIAANKLGQLKDLLERAVEFRGSDDTRNI